jgi:hypothetical protein
VTSKLVGATPSISNQAWKLSVGGLPVVNGGDVSAPLYCCGDVQPFFAC